MAWFTLSQLAFVFIFHAGLSTTPRGRGRGGVVDGLRSRSVQSKWRFEEDVPDV